ncbi:diguanylate cyclase domain-containing protein [Vacuolonema iberomarrocanum]|uniref:GGDEF domain-containing protein n=1 Tax=Vacuolonema iberomarrocanum TaxID=3454632 RepID=UPI001A0511CB|nr:sensor domain-containing diguanylate cyclase [filamentous cyanobacterium LEGE 07170]
MTDAQIDPWENSVGAALSADDPSGAIARSLHVQMHQALHPPGQTTLVLQGQALALCIGLDQEIATVYTSIFLSPHPESSAEGLSAEGLERATPGMFQLPSIPSWFESWWQAPCIAQLDTGVLLIPVRGDVESLATETPQRSVDGLDAALLVATTFEPDALPWLQGDHPFTAPPTGWAAAEISYWSAQAQHLGAAYQQAIQTIQLEQVRQQRSLVGRVVHLLNSALQPDQVLHQILAEVGQQYDSDRILLLDLRTLPSVSVINQWSADASEPPVRVPTEPFKAVWQELVDLFLQDGASYLVMHCAQPEPESLVDLCTLFEVATLVMIPVFLKAEFFGVLMMGTDQIAGTDPRTDLPIFYQIADHAAIALHQIMQTSQSRPGNTEREEGRLTPVHAWWDTLTRLPNRPALERDLSQLSHPTLWPVDPPFSVLLGDIDYFKLINDTHGTAAGDQVLQEVARRLQNQLRQGTKVYRFDGEEFLMLLDGTLLKAAADVAERLRAAVQQLPITTTAGRINATISFGIAQKDLTRDRHASDIVQRAEQALLDAKRDGRNRIKVV